MTLNNFSQKFAVKLQEKYPEFQKYIKVVNDAEYEEPYLEVNVPSPANPNVELHISTEDYEITIGFDWFHTHFLYCDNEEEVYNEALDFLNQFINEELIIIIVRKSGQWEKSLRMKPGNQVKIKEGRTVTIKSWNGTYNREVEVNHSNYMLVIK